MRRLLSMNMVFAVALWRALSQEIDTYVVVESDWTDHAAHALECEDGGSAAEVCMKDTANVSAWSGPEELGTILQQLSTIPEETASGIVMVFVGSRMASQLDDHKRLQELERLFKSVVLIHTSVTQRDLRLCATSQCSVFDYSRGVFALAAAAALVQWTQRALAVLTDWEVDAAHDPVFQAFVNGAKFIDPDLSVFRRQVVSTGWYQEYHVQAVASEVSGILDRASVIFLDLRGRDAIEGALLAVVNYRTSKKVSQPFVILPPNFPAFDGEGAPLQPWKDVILNALSIDVARAIKMAIRTSKSMRSPGVKLLKFRSGYVTTLWTPQKELAASQWMLNYTGNFSLLDDSVHRNAEQDCGPDQTVKQHLTNTLMEIVRSSSNGVGEEGMCEVSSMCCAPQQPPVLAGDWNPMVHCGDDACGEDNYWPVLGYPRACLGGSKNGHGCPQLPPVTYFGLGILVGNLAELDLASGSFFVEANLYTFEYTTHDRREGLGQPMQECVFDSQPTSIQWSTEVEFWSRVTLLGRDRWLSAFPAIVRQENVPSYLNLRGIMYFEANLHHWPFDQQDLELEFELTNHRKNKNVRICTMPAYTAISADIRLTGVRPDFHSILAMSSRVSETCSAPFKHPNNHCTKYVGQGRNSLCRECERPELQAFPHDGADSCKCMGGSRPSSRASFTIHFHRPAGRLLLSIFLPPLTIILLNQAVVWLRPQASESRVMMSSSSFVASVMYHVTISSSTPTTARQITKADLFMMICYGVNLAILFSALIQYLAYSASDEEMKAWVANGLYFASRYLVTILTLTFVLSIFWVETILQVVLLYALLGAIFALCQIYWFAKFYEAHPAKRETLKQGLARRFSMKPRSSQAAAVAYEEAFEQE